MAGEIIRPSALPDRPNPVASEKVPVDNGVTVGGATIEKLVLAGRPTASQPEAEAGTDPLKAMTPLTTKQAIDAIGGAQFATTVQGALAESAVQPGDLGTAAFQAATDFATAAQGAKADTAYQPTTPLPSVNRGDWSAATAYAVNDRVQYANQTWIALVANTNVIPTEGATWSLLSASAGVADGAVTLPKLASSVYASQAEAEAGTDNVHLMTPLRTLQQAKERGYFSLNDFAGTVIDNGSNSAVSAFQSAVNSGEHVQIPKASDSFLLDGNVAINNPIKLLGMGNGSKIKRVSNVGSFLLRSSHIHLGGFVEDGSAMTGTRALFYMDTATGASPIYIQHSIIENVRSFHSGGLFDDNDAKGSSPTPVIWDLLVRNVYAFGCRGRGIRMRDGFAFLRFEDVQVGLGPQNMGAEYAAYEFRNFEGLFLRRVECTGLAGYTDLGYTPTVTQRGFIFANGAALHINSLFADNNVGEGARFENVQYIDGNDLNSSINSGTGFYFANADRVNINTLRSGGRRNMAPGTLDATSFGVWMDASCAKVNMGQIVTHNWGNHGFYSQATDLMLTGLQSFDNGGRGYVAEGSTGRSLLVGGQLRDNVAGNYFIGGTSVNKMASLQLSDGSYVDSVTTQPATG